MNKQNVRPPREVQSLQRGIPAVLMGLCVVILVVAFPPAAVIPVFLSVVYLTYKFNRALHSSGPPLSPVDDESEPPRHRSILFDFALRGGFALMQLMAVCVWMFVAIILKNNFILHNDAVLLFIAIALIVLVRVYSWLARPNRPDEGHP